MIGLWDIVLLLVPAGAVVLVSMLWSANAGTMLYALFRMSVQLIAIGYLLVFIFDSDSAYMVLAVLCVMLVFSGWIALRTVPQRRVALFFKALLSIAVGGGITLSFVTVGVLKLQPWYLPSYMVPLAGMVFANAMNSVSLAVERFFTHIEESGEYLQARSIALRTALIPVVNSLFAVGLVSLPGMMTGQILSGVSPLIAVRYQIVIMLMVFSAAGLSASMLLFMIGRDRQGFVHNMDSVDEER